MSKTGTPWDAGVAV